MKPEIDISISNTATAACTTGVGGAVLFADEHDPLPFPNTVSSNNGTTNSSTTTQHTIQDKDGVHHPVPEFLCQLTKLLTDNCNQDIIDWSDGKIRLHDPSRIEGILGKYFRHSKFASFQRQLNYFGFRKIAGKGKLAPCAYTNDVATSDISSLMNVKRKTNGSAARKLAAERAVLASSVPPAVAPSAPPPCAPPQPFPFFPMGVVPPNTSAAAAALNTQLGLLALQQQHQQLQQQLMQQQQRAFLEQQQKALIEQHQKTLLEQHCEQLRMAEANAKESLTAASLGQGGNKAASAVVATAATISQSPPNETKHPATAALEALIPEPATTAPAPAAPSVQESVANLTSLLRECVPPHEVSELLRQQLPSQSMIFPSMLSLNSFPSRNNSHAELEKR